MNYSFVNTFKYSSVIISVSVIIGNLTITWKEKQMKLKDLSQISMPNSQNIIINFSSQPHVCMYVCM